jgi:hypothetical protein
MGLILLMSYLTPKAAFEKAVLALDITREALNKA